jgi:hypothetical protein
MAEASAQTSPAAAHKTTKKTTTRATRRTAKKTQRVARKTAPVKATSFNDGWDVPTAETVVAAAEPQAAAWGGGTTSARQGADAVYAAPGMSVHIRTGREMDNYDGTPRKPAASQQTTLSQR